MTNQKEDDNDYNSDDDDDHISDNKYTLLPDAGTGSGPCHQDGRTTASLKVQASLGKPHSKKKTVSF